MSFYENKLFVKNTEMQQVTILTMLVLAQYGALAAPLGALKSSVAQDGLNLPSLGAPRTFDLFYPKLPSLRPAKETSSAVPVIHLPEDEEMESIGKAAADAYLDMFPQDLLDSNRKVKPIDVRIIEHEGFIDYEIEFVELSEEELDEYNGDFPITTTLDQRQELSTDVKVTTQRTLTTLPNPISTGVTAFTFIDLLMRARRRHRNRNRLKTDKQRLAPLTIGTTLPTFPLQAIVDMSGSQPSKTLPSVQITSEQSKISFQRINITRKENETPTSHQLVPKKSANVATSKTFNLVGKSTNLSDSLSRGKLRMDVENKLDSETNNDEKFLSATQPVLATPNYNILSAIRPSSPGYVPNSDSLLKKNDRSSEDSKVDISDIEFTTTKHQEIQYTTKHPGQEINSTELLMEELKQQLITISYNTSREQTVDEGKIPTSIETHASIIINEVDNLQIRESESVIDLHTADKIPKKKPVETERVFQQPQFLEENISKQFNLIDNEPITKITNGEILDEIQLFTEASTDTDHDIIHKHMQVVQLDTDYVQPERAPKKINVEGSPVQLIEDSKALKDIKEFHTVSPSDIIKGEYHEINPGQYHELNPGQYHESNPGQYHETNPGQYDEKHPGQDFGVDNLTVDFDHTADSRVYNVKANAGDFIIGEVGRIDINSGQTFEGVRYTAVEGEVDEAKISDILMKYFGTQTS